MKIKYLAVLSLLSMMIFYANSVNADISSEVGSWFTNMSYSTSTSPGVYQGQSANYYTLGGYSARAPIHAPFTLVNIQTPKLSAGCGGIDFYSGGFSAINADQFVQELRDIGQNATSLAFMLAIQIVSPQLSSTMQEIQDWANKYLNMEKNSCQAAEALVGGTAKLFGDEHDSCALKRMEEDGETYSQATYQCTTGGNLASTENSTTGPNLVDFVKGNLAWYILMQNPMFNNADGTDPSFTLAQLVMNMTGTLIIEPSNTTQDDAPKNVTRILPSVLKDGTLTERGENIYKALLFGTQATDGLQIYTCTGALSSDPQSCTTISSTPQSMTVAWTGLHQKIQDMVANIIANIRSDTPLTLAQKGLISSTTIPLYKYLAAASAYFPSTMNISGVTNDYTSLIANDVLLRGLKSVIDNVTLSASNLQHGMSNGNIVKAYRKQLIAVQKGISQIQKTNEFNINHFVAMQKQITLYDEALQSRLSSSLVSNAAWTQ